MPLLVNLQRAGQKVALVTDGRLSGASGRVLGALHLTPEAAAGGVLARIENGDWIEVDARSGVLQVELTAAELEARVPAQPSTEYAAGFWAGFVCCAAPLGWTIRSGRNDLGWE